MLVFVFLLNNVYAIEFNRFVENFSKSDVNSNTFYHAVIKFSYDFAPHKSESNIVSMRKHNKNYFTEKNEEYANNVDFQGLDVSLSSYSPYCFIKFENYNEYVKAKNKLNIICDYDQIEMMTIEIYNPKQESVNINSNKSSKTISMSKIKEIVGLNSNHSSTGDNIKVGVIDSGYPDDEDEINKYPIFNNVVSYNQISNLNTTDEELKHSATVLSILYDIAPSIDVYFTEYNFAVYLDDRIEWLLDNNVNIINMSQHDTGTAGYYTGYCAYVAYIAANNNVLFVKSAGNISNTKYISSPGLALNALTVGSVCPDLNISFFSSYRMNSQYSTTFIKPNLVAPGENINIILKNSSNETIYQESIFGTSFSTPIVSAIAALLMQDNSSLKIYISKLINLLMASATPLSGQTNLIEDECGTGIVNYTKAKALLSNSHSEVITVNEDSSGQVVNDFWFYYDGSKKNISMVTITTYKIELNKIPNQTYPGSENSEIHSTRYYLEILDTNYNHIITYYPSYNILFERLNLEMNKQYICNIVMNSSRPSDNEDIISILIT